MEDVSGAPFVESFFGKVDEMAEEFRVHVLLRIMENVELNSNVNIEREGGPLVRIALNSNLNIMPCANYMKSPGLIQHSKSTLKNTI